jgi:hypothetical protein
VSGVRIIVIFLERLPEPFDESFSLHAKPDEDLVVWWSAEGDPGGGEVDESFGLLSSAWLSLP